MLPWLLWHCWSAVPVKPAHCELEEDVPPAELLPLVLPVLVDGLVVLDGLLLELAPLDGLLPIGELPMLPLLGVVLLLPGVPLLLLPYPLVCAQDALAKASMAAATAALITFDVMSEFLQVDERDCAALEARTVPQEFLTASLLPPFMKSGSEPQTRKKRKSGSDPN